MRACILALGLTLVGAPSASAQIIEVFGGYSYANTEFNIAGPAIPGGVRNVDVPAGWTAGGGVFVLPDVMLVGQFSQHTGSEDLGAVHGEGTAAFRTVMFGPRLLDRRGVLEYWVAGFVGVMRTEIDDGVEVETASSLAVALGGGLDLVFGGVGVRVFQGEAVFGSALLSNPAPRFSFGAFYRF